MVRHEGVSLLAEGSSTSNASLKWLVLNSLANQVISRGWVWVITDTRLPTILIDSTPRFVQYGFRRRLRADKNHIDSARHTYKMIIGKIKHS
jgi:hypothetical protein